MLKTFFSNKILLTLKTLRIKYFFCLPLGIFFLNIEAGCNKDKDAVSHDSIRFSLNDSLPATCKMPQRPGSDYIGNPNCALDVNRMGAFETGEDALIGIYASNDCNLMSSPLPYQTRNFLVSAWVYEQPWKLITYAYNNNDTLINTRGDLILTIIQRDNNRVRGTIKGIIYRSDYSIPLPSKFDCTFDLAIPLR
jgi:hypothetical protein